MGEVAIEEYNNGEAVLLITLLYFLKYLSK